MAVFRSYYPDFRQDNSNPGVLTLNMPFYDLTIEPWPQRQNHDDSQASIHVLVHLRKRTLKGWLESGLRNFSLTPRLKALVLARDGTFLNRNIDGLCLRWENRAQPTPKEPVVDLAVTSSNFS